MRLCQLCCSFVLTVVIWRLSLSNLSLFFLVIFSSVVHSRRAMHAHGTINKPPTGGEAAQVSLDGSVPTAQQREGAAVRAGKSLSNALSSSICLSSSLFPHSPGPSVMQPGDGPEQRWHVMAPLSTSQWAKGGKKL